MTDMIIDVDHTSPNPETLDHTKTYYPTSLFDGKPYTRPLAFHLAGLYDQAHPQPTSPGQQLQRLGEAGPSKPPPPTTGWVPNRRGGFNYIPHGKIEEGTESGSVAGTDEATSLRTPLRARRNNVGHVFGLPATSTPPPAPTFAAREVMAEATADDYYASFGTVPLAEPALFGTSPNSLPPMLFGSGNDYIPTVSPSTSNILSNVNILQPPRHGAPLRQPRTTPSIFATQQEPFLGLLPAETQNPLDELSFQLTGDENMPFHLASLPSISKRHGSDLEPSPSSLRRATLPYAVPPRQISSENENKQDKASRKQSHPHRAPLTPRQSENSVHPQVDHSAHRDDTSKKSSEAPVKPRQRDEFSRQVRMNCALAEETLEHIEGLRLHLSQQAPTCINEHDCTSQDLRWILGWLVPLLKLHGENGPEDHGEGSGSTMDRLKSLNRTLQKLRRACELRPSSAEHLERLLDKIDQHHSKLLDLAGKLADGKGFKIVLPRDKTKKSRLL